MNWKHLSLFCVCIGLCFFGFTILHVVLGHVTLVNEVDFFSLSMPVYVAADLGFFAMGTAVILLLLLYFTKAKPQVITFQNGAEKAPANIEVANHHITEAILILRPATKKPPHVHIASRVEGIDSALEVERILQQTNAKEILSLNVQE